MSGWPDERVPGVGGEWFDDRQLPVLYWPAGHPVPYEVGEIMKRDAEPVIGQARRDIAAGEEIVVAFDIVSEVETGADVGPVLAE